MKPCFDVNNMNSVVGSYCPEGEKVIASVFGIGEVTMINQFFTGCKIIGDNLVPDNNDNVLKVTKRNGWVYDLYVACTEKSLIISECENIDPYQYEVFLIPPNTVGANKVEKEISRTSIGKTFPLDTIKDFKVKKGWFGSLKCTVLLENDTVFNFMLAKRAGVPGKMPDHIKNRDKVLEVLKKYSK